MSCSFVTRRFSTHLDGGFYAIAVEGTGAAVCPVDRCVVTLVVALRRIVVLITDSAQVACRSLSSVNPKGPIFFC
jgi:hypothetical protein